LHCGVTMRKKIFLTFLISIIFIFLFLGISPRVSAVITLDNPIRWKSFSEFIDRVISIFFYIGIALAPLMIVAAAFFFLTSAGDPQKVQTAQQLLIYTCVGIFLILIAKVIIALIKKILGA